MHINGCLKWWVKQSSLQACGQKPNRVKRWTFLLRLMIYLKLTQPESNRAERPLTSEWSKLWKCPVYRKKVILQRKNIRSAKAISTPLAQSLTIAEQKVRKLYCGKQFKNFMMTSGKSEICKFIINCVPGTEISAFWILIYSNPMSRCYYYPYFIDEESEAQRD